MAVLDRGRSSCDTSPRPATRRPAIAMLDPVVSQCSDKQQRSLGMMKRPADKLMAHTCWRPWQGADSREQLDTPV
jgi:hypothetical protein